MADDDNKIEIEIALRDMMSTGLRQIGRELDAQNRRARESAVGVSASLGKVGVSAENLQVKTKTATGSLNVMGGLMAVMGRNLLGPVGIAAGLVTVAKSVKDFAQHTVTVRTLANNARMTTEQFNRIVQAERRSGKDLNEATQIAVGIGDVFLNVLSQLDHSRLTKALEKMGHGEVAQAVQAHVTANEVWKAWLDVVDDYQKSSDRDKERIAKEGFGRTRDEFEAFIEHNAEFMEQYEGDPEKMAKLYSDLTSASIFLSNIWDSLRSRAAESFSDAVLGLNKIYDTGIAASLKRYKEEGIKLALSVVEVFKHPSRIPSAMLDFMTSRFVLGPIGAMGFAAAKDAVDLALGKTPESMLPKKAAGGIAWGPSIVGEAGPEMVIPLSKFQQMIDPISGGIDAAFDRWLARQHPNVRRFVEQSALPGQRMIDAAKAGGVDWASLAPMLLSELGPQPMMPPGMFGMGDVGRVMLAELMSTAGAYSLTPFLAGGYGGQVGSPKISDLQKLQEIEADSSHLLVDISTTLRQMEDPLGFKKFGEGGTVKVDTKALLGERPGQSEIVLPSGMVVDKPTKGILSAGSTVIPISERSLGEKYQIIREAATAAGSPNPDLTASIAMHESGWLGGGVFKKSGDTNPFGQTGYGPAGAVIGRPEPGFPKGQPHKVYHSLKEGIADHLSRWSSFYDPGSVKRSLSNLVRGGYNTVSPGWTSGITAIHKKMGGSEISGFHEPTFANISSDRNRLDNALQNEAGGGASADGTVTASVDFADMKSESPVPWLPMKSTTSPQAGLAAANGPMHAAPYAWGY